jgi:hypothetical protein
MCGIETVEPTAIYPPLKSLFIVYNRKLRSFMDESTIENSEFVDQIVERGPEIITSLPHNNAKASIEREEMVGLYNNLLRMVRVGFDLDGIHLFLPPFHHLPYKISKVFLCPVQSSESVVERGWLGWLRQFFGLPLATMTKALRNRRLNK